MASGSTQIHAAYCKPPALPLLLRTPLHGAQLLADLAQAVEHRLQRLSRGLEVHGLHVAHDALPHGRLGDLRALALRRRQRGPEVERGAVRAPASGPARSGSPSGKQCWQRSSRPRASRRPRDAATRSVGASRAGVKTRIGSKRRALGCVGGGWGVGGRGLTVCAPACSCHCGRKRPTIWSSSPGPAACAAQRRGAGRARGGGRAAAASTHLAVAGGSRRRAPRRASTASPRRLR